jgi:anti-anti-sigma regulatory factor
VAGPDPVPPRRAPRLPPHAQTRAVLVVAGAVGRGDARRLCRRARELLAANGAASLVCDVAGVEPATAEAVDVLARIALTARRAGRGTVLRGPSPALVALIDLCGLARSLPCEPGSVVEPRR